MPDISGHPSMFFPCLSQLAVDS